MSAHGPRHTGRAALRGALAGFAVLALTASAQAAALKIATVVPEGSAWMREMREAAAEIRERTEGRVRIKFYPGGVMGDEQTVLRKIRIGQLHGGAFTSGALKSLYADADLYSVPLMFRTFAEVDYVRERMDDSLRRGLAQAGLEVLAISDGGFAHLLSQRPIRTTLDLRGTKIWIQEGDVVSRTALELADVSPVPLSIADVYTGLQTGLIDTVAVPPMAAIAFQWHTKVKFMTDVPLMYLSGVLAVAGRALAKLEAEDRAVVREVIGGASARLDAEGRKGHEQAKRALLEHGVEEVVVGSDEELALWHGIAESALTELQGQGIYSRGTIDELRGHLERYRNTTPAAHDP